MFDVTIIGAVLAGLLSFLSPCILPIVPFYLSYLAGVGMNQITADAEITPAVRRRAGQAEVVLQTCPFVDAAEANPAVVCALHLGLAESTAEAAGVAVTGLVPRPPRRAGCRLTVRDGSSGR